jgi:glycosyltransferase involved in cell wall biosynthesis
MPRISVIIPVYNGEKTIRATIETVLKQTFSDFELIVIDDGSQDATLEIISEFRDTRIKVLSGSNRGVSVARNRGIAQASGDFIAFLDADDLWTPNKLEAQFNALQTNPQAAVAYSWTDYIDESGQFLYPGSHITLNGNVYSQLLVKNFLENGSNPLIRTHVLKTVGAFDESLSPSEDWDMWLRLAANYDFVAVPSPQILYRISSNSASSNISKQAIQGLKVINKYFNQAPHSLKFLKKLSLANFYQYLIFKTLDEPLTRQKSLLAARFLGHTIINNPLILRQRTRLMVIVLLKVTTGVFLPAEYRQFLLKKLKTIKINKN